MSCSWTPCETPFSNSKMNNPKTLRYGLSDDDYRRIVDVMARRTVVERAILYGSRAKGTHKPGSDIDLVLVGDLTWEELHRIETELDDLMLPYQFDLSLLAQIENPALLEHIRRVGKTLYQKGVSLDGPAVRQETDGAV